jgi:glycosyltransferase domain-containing protein
VLKSLLTNLRGRGGDSATVPGPAASTDVPARQSRFDDRLSVVVPSVAGRKVFFERALHHLAACSVRWPVFVTDHSRPGEEAVLAEVAAHYPALDVRLIRHPPEMHFLERLARCAEAAQTDYVVLHADDDFMMPGAIEASIAFLDEHPGFGACMGRMAFFRVADGGKVIIGSSDGRTRAEETPAARVVQQVANFTPTLYAVHRRGLFVESCLRTLEVTTNVTFWQYLASCITVARGKLKTLDGIYYLRLNNKIGWRSQLIAQRDPSHWPYLAVASDFSTELAAFRRALLDLVGGDAGRDALATEIDDACLWLIRRGLCSTNREPPEPQEEAFLKRLNTLGTEEQRHLAYCVRCVRGGG